MFTQVASTSHRDVTRQPPPPFITSTLQQEASSKLGFSPDQTMSIAQQLYEGKDSPDGKLSHYSQLHDSVFSCAALSQSSCSFLPLMRLCAWYCLVRAFWRTTDPSIYCGVQDCRWEGWGGFVRLSIIRHTTFVCNPILRINLNLINTSALEAHGQHFRCEIGAAWQMRGTSPTPGLTASRLERRPWRISERWWRAPTGSASW